MSAAALTSRLRDDTTEGDAIRAPLEGEKNSITLADPITPSKSSVMSGQATQCEDEG